MTDAATPEIKTKKPSRWGLFAPLLVAAVLFAAWSGYWFFTAHQIEKRITDHLNGLVSAGYQVDHEGLKVGGYPFRMFISADKTEVIAPSGKGFAASHLEAEASAFVLDKWVIVATEGLTLHRGHLKDGTELGTVRITGDALRASISGLNDPVRDLRFEGINPVFVVSNPEHPFFISQAQRFEAYMRPTEATPDSADFLWRVNGARGEPASLSGRIGQSKPFNLHLEGVIDKFSALKGSDLTERLNNWRDQGGSLKRLRSSLIIDQLDLFAQSENLTIDANRALKGPLELEIKGQGDAVGFLIGSGLIAPKYEPLARPFIGSQLIISDKPVKLGFDFHDGGTYVGTLKLSDAPVIH
ncbi:MAG: DUF2125 domain-containing protein [Asticcacaulis sp.]